MTNSFPRLLIAIFIFIMTISLLLSCSDDDNPVKPNPTWQWSAIGEGVNDRVLALLEYDGQLVVAGFFDSAGGIAANNIAVWDGTTWSTLGSGMNGEVCALTIHEGQLIAGGLFTTAGGVPASNLAAWDGSSWTELEGGTNGKVYALSSYTAGTSDELFVGGSFTQTGSTPTQNLSILNDHVWGTFGTDTFKEPIYVLTSDSIYTYLGGHIKSLINIPVNGIAIYAGIGIPILDDGVRIDDTVGTVYAIACHDGKVYFGGLFDEIGGVPARNIGWNTGFVPNSWGVWDSCGSGTSGGPVTSPVHALSSFNGNLIAGGYFGSAGGITASKIASWNGTTWSALGRGMEGPNWPHVWALTTYNGKLIAGGRFTTAGGKEANNIAMWELK